MSSNKQPPGGRKKDSIHFVNARPSSEKEKLRIQRLVRAHVGKWISDQTKDRSAAPESSDSQSSSDRKKSSDSVPQIVDLDEDEALFPSSSSPSADSSRGSPESPPAPSLSLPLRPVSRGPMGFHTTPTPIKFVSQNQDNYIDIDENDYEYNHNQGQMLVNATAFSQPQYADYIEVIGGNVLDPFQTYPSNFSPQDVHAMENYCLTTLWPTLTPANKSTNIPGSSSWFPLSLSDPTLFTAFMFGALFHQHIRWVNRMIPDGAFRPRDQQLLQLSEYETIKMVNEALSDPTRAVSDAIILSILCMAHGHASESDRARSRAIPFTSPLKRLQWLDVYAAVPPNVIHLQGLVELIKLRGGLQNIELPGLAPIISFSDILTASYFLSRPMFPFIPLDNVRRNITLQELLGYGPLDIERGFGGLQQIGFTPEMAEVFQALRTYTNIVKLHLKGAQINLENPLLCDQRNFLQHNLMNIPSASQVDGFFTYKEQKTIYEACRLAAIIYGSGVTFPLPAACSPLLRVASLLQNLLRTPDAPNIWSHPQAQVALIWILTMGGIAADKLHERGWFVTVLSQATRHNQIFTWFDLKRVLESMLWYDVACDQPGYALWLEVERLSVNS